MKRSAKTARQTKMLRLCLSGVDKMKREEVTV